MFDVGGSELKVPLMGSSKLPMNLAGCLWGKVSIGTGLEALSERVPFTPGSPIEKRLAGLGTPVLRLMLNLRDPKPMPNMLAAAMMNDQCWAPTGGRSK